MAVTTIDIPIMFKGEVHKLPIQKEEFNKLNEMFSTTSPHNILSDYIDREHHYYEKYGAYPKYLPVVSNIYMRFLDMYQLVSNDEFQAILAKFKAKIVTHNLKPLLNIDKTPYKEYKQRIQDIIESTADSHEDALEFFNRVCTMDKNDREVLKLLRTLTVDRETAQKRAKMIVEIITSLRS